MLYRVYSTKYIQSGILQWPCFYISMCDKLPFHLWKQQVEQKQILSEVKSDVQDSSETKLQKAKKVQNHTKLKVSSVQLSWYNRIALQPFEICIDFKMISIVVWLIYVLSISFIKVAFIYSAKHLLVNKSWMCSQFYYTLMSRWTELVFVSNFPMIQWNQLLILLH